MKIRAVIFDLDGTLIQTEKLKARAYARAAIELCPYEIEEEDVFRAYADFVGGSRKEAAQGLVAKFKLDKTASLRLKEFSASEPWQVLTRLRLKILDEMLADKEILLNHRRGEPFALLQFIRAQHCKVALATMSHCQQVTRVLEALNLERTFDFIATREDVDAPKPDPEIYTLVAEALQIPIESCLILEDSPAGVRAGLTAGAEVIAIGTEITREKLHQDKKIRAAHILDDPAKLHATVKALMEAHNSKSQNE
jgi:beta-phosphoglucomutase-like phosphatase (HAD superfamily)